MKPDYPSPWTASWFLRQRRFLMKSSLRVPVWSFTLLTATAVVAAGAWWLRTADDSPQKATGPAWFADVTATAKVDFVHDAGPFGAYFMPQALGSGVAILDFDGDGLMDLYFLNNGGPTSKSTNRLYRQNPDGTFADVSAGSGLDIPGHNMGVAIGDIDNDGWPDVLVTQYGGVKLFRNNGDGKSFTDITEKSGVVNPTWGMSAVFFDFDRDGWLDLVIVNYVDYDPTIQCAPKGRPEFCGPSNFPGRVTKLFRNKGKQDDGLIRFEDVTIPSGLGAVAGPGLGVICADFDGDGWPDIFVANDGKPNHLWINQRDGAFREEAMARGVALNGMGKAEAGMGVALGDASGNGLFDLYVTHLTEETHALWRQGPRGFFRDLTVASNLAATRWRGTGFGVMFGDFDNDGALDIAIANGRIAHIDTPASSRFATGPWAHYAERNQLLANDGSGRFRDISADNPALCENPNVARGLAIGDLDNDGGLDVVLTTAAHAPMILRNVAPRGNWLTLRLIDPALKRDAYGAEVRVIAGARRWLRLVQPGGSYLCSSDPRVHMGLGSAAAYDRIEVAWPDGLHESFSGGKSNEQRVLKRGEGEKMVGEHR
jgi:hypothetical protein